MGGGAGTGEGVEDDSIFIADDLQNKLNQTRRLGRIKRGFSLKNREEFFLGFIRMPSIIMLPKICWKFAADIFKIGFSGNAALSTLSKEEARPLSTLVYKSGMSSRFF